MNTQTSYFKKALVMLMAVIMVFTYMPSMAWADSGDSGTVATPKSCLAFGQDLEEGTHFYPYETGGKISLEVELASYYYDANGVQQPLPADAKVAYTLFKDQVRQSTIMNPHFDIPIQESMAGQTMTFYIKAVTKIEGTLYQVDSKTYTVEIGPKPIDVTLSVGNQGKLASVGEKAAINLPVTVVDLNQDKQFSVDEAMVAAHKTYLQESDYVRTTTEDGNVEVSKLWGTETANASFYVNGTAAAATKTLTAGNTIYASAGTAGETYIYAAFHETKKRVLPNETFTLTLTDNNDKPLSGVAIGTWEKGTFTALNEIITDEKGGVSLTLPKGSYLLSAQGKVNITENGAGTAHTIIAPFCEVECAMPGGNCGGLGGNEGNATWSYDVGTKKLTINGTGTIGGRWETRINIIPPWKDYRDEIESIEIGEGITEIVKFLFRGSTSVKSIHLPNTLQRVGDCAFMDCKALTEISFAKGSKAKLGGGVFEGCTALTEVALPTGVTVRAQTTFGGCTALAKATVTNVAKSMFAGCTALKEVIYQEGATTFGNSPFAGLSVGGTGYEACKTVEKVWIPESLTVWGNAFDDEMLGKITFDGPGKDNFFFAEDGSIYNQAKTEMYYAGSGALGTVIIPKTVTALKPYAFANRTELKKVIFEEGSSLTEIAAHCFEGCTALKEVENLPSTLQDIKDSAFSGCSALSEIKLPDAVKTIGSNAFKDTSLQSITLPGGLQSLGSGAFMNCTKLTKLELPDKLSAFGIKVIQGTSVEEIVLPETITELSKEQFYQCTSLKHVIVKGNIAKIPENAFMGCTALESITLPETVTAIDDGAFSGEDSMIYFAGPWEKWPDQKGKKFAGAVIANYVQPTTKTGAFEVVEKSADIVSRDAAELKQKTISLKLRYPSEAAKREDDKITVDWYYTEQTPDGLKHLKYLSSGNCTPSGSDLVTTLSLEAQGGSAKMCTWNYVCVIFKTTADGATTMLTSEPIEVSLLDSEFSLEGSGSEKSPFAIKSYEDLQTISEWVKAGNRFTGQYFILAADNIEVKQGWESIGTSENPFEGIFDGDNKTVIHEKGTGSLFGTVGSTTIKNVQVKGEYIASSGLVWSIGPSKYDGASATLFNCKLLSGSTTHSSGLVGYSGGVNIINCEVQSNVRVGWDAEAEQPDTFGYIGSIICQGAFNLVGCKSAADVTSKGNYVGGLAGYKTYAMRFCSVENSQFTGSINADGEYIGGILGGGYDEQSAPNTLCVKIENCYVNADITGAQAVGGLFGGEGGCDQAWDNGIGYIRNNVFYGALHLNGEEVAPPRPTQAAPADNIGGSKGAITGFMRSLNKCNVIENNYYFITNGKEEKGIGAVEHIDTSKIRPMGMHDGVYYYDTSKDSLKEVCDWVDREDGIDREYSSVGKYSMNRDDDPLGEDKDKIAKACSRDEMTNGSIVGLLNAHASSMHNWVQGENCPVLSDKAVAYKIEVSGDYQKEYYIGDKLNLSDIQFTVTWSDGTTTNPTLENGVTVTGFDSSKQAIVHLTAAYENATCDFTVKINKRADGTPTNPNTIKVNLTLLGDSLHGENGESHTLKNGGLTEWLPSKDYEVDLNATVWDFLQEVEKKATNPSVKFNAENSQYGMYISSVTYNGTNGTIELGQMDNGPSSGWMYTLNGKHPLLAVSEQFLKDGDKIVFHYTDDYTVEQGSEDWNTPGGTVEEVKDVTTDTKSGTTTAPTEVKVSEKTNADGTKTKVADVKVSADNQKEILKQVKDNNSNEIILVVSSKSVGDATKADITLDKSFINSIVKDTNAKLTIRTPFGDKTYTQEELKAMSEAATGSTVTVAIEKAAEEEPQTDVKALTAKLTPVARSAKTAKKNVKVTVSLDKQDKAMIQELKDAGYTVKYRFYRSTKKAAGYKAAVTKKTASYTNTSGKKGTKYFYKVQVRAYDENGKLVAKTALKQCKYATRTWSKAK